MCPLNMQEEKADAQGEKPKESKGSRIRKALSKPIGPPDPESKHTAIHIRLTYKELAEDQVHFYLVPFFPQTVVCL